MKSKAKRLVGGNTFAQALTVAFSCHTKMVKIKCEAEPTLIQP